MFLKTNTRHQAYKPLNKCNYWGPIFEAEWSTGSSCVSGPNFVATGPTFADKMAIFRLFKTAAAAIIDF